MAKRQRSITLSPRGLDECGGPWKVARPEDCREKYVYIVKEALAQSEACNQEQACHEEQGCHQKYRT
jgi:hypothetical protein